MAFIMEKTVLSMQSEVLGRVASLPKITPFLVFVHFFTDEWVANHNLGLSRATPSLEPGFIFPPLSGTAMSPEASKKPQCFGCTQSSLRGQRRSQKFKCGECG